ncbi:MAG: GTPase HflX [Candidatus Hydrothermarchaeota archaeon]|jgi:GTP-binding protein HflX|nr:GTPase HflX [Candidatus Hydrothermarchaeota archaeon]MDP6612635.1 GTPase HflX [Candidatus Hydrothermarchaeota archaeon]
MRAVIAMLRGEEFEERCGETEKLARTAGYDILKTFSQAAKPRARFLLGQGKVREIEKFVQQEGVELVVLENYLTSRQVMSLEGEFRVPVIDKFDLILNVFEKHAQSREAKLQIELARLKRKLPYIKMFMGRRVREDHPGFGSSGEYIINSTIAAIHKRIKKIDDKLEKFDKRVEAQGKRRREKSMVVSLVGYTNVGKTTILNRLTNAEKPVRDELFTTLSPKAASVYLGDRKVIINDTLGFIRNLPHELIYAFRATLEEVVNSDLLLLILDVSEPLAEFNRKCEICEKTLVKIGANSVPTIYVLNKADLVENVRKEKLINGIVLSAKFGQGFTELKAKIERTLT